MHHDTMKVRLSGLRHFVPLESINAQEAETFEELDPKSVLARQSLKELSIS
jgi:hypothetical protein